MFCLFFSVHLSIAVSAVKVSLNFCLIKAFIGICSYVYVKFLQDAVLQIGRDKTFLNLKPSTIMSESIALITICLNL